MKIATGYSEKATVTEAIGEISNKLGDVAPKAVIYFSSMKYDPAKLAEGMEAAFGGAAVFGCTTAGEIISGKMLKGSVVAMAIGSEIIDDVCVEVVADINKENNVAAAFSAFEKHFGGKMQELDVNRHVGIILTDGMSGAEEVLMDTIGDMTNVTFIGAAAGDDLAFKSTCVFAGGKSHTNAAVLALLRLNSDFDIIKTQSFKLYGKRLVATRVNEAAREVVEFDGKPAAAAYAEALGIPQGEAADQFMRHPVGLMVGGEPYVRSPQQVKDGSIIFYCQVLQGMELEILESTDIVEDTRKAVKDKAAEMGGISGIINFHCILRTLELENIGRTADYGGVFSDIPTIGFSTYGEEYVGHINQTSTMLAFK